MFGLESKKVTKIKKSLMISTIILQALPNIRRNRVVKSREDG
jgi:hypothetical protein